MIELTATTPRATLYTSLLAKKEDSQLSRASNAADWRAVQAARSRSPPEKPTSPNRQQINTLGMVAGSRSDWR